MKLDVYRGRKTTTQQEQQLYINQINGSTMIKQKWGIFEHKVLLLLDILWVSNSTSHLLGEKKTTRWANESIIPGLSPCPLPKKVYVVGVIVELDIRPNGVQYKRSAKWFTTTRLTI